MKDNFKYLIWTNNPYRVDYDDLAKDIAADYKENFNEEMSNDAAYDAAYEYINSTWYDEKANLSGIKTEGEIICIGSLGLWNGRVSGYKEMNTRDVTNCLGSDDDYYSIGIDKNDDLIAEGVHHDGTNYYLFRSFKPDLSYIQKDNFLSKIYDGKATRRDVTRYTESVGKLIKDVYF